MLRKSVLILALVGMMGVSAPLPAYAADECAETEVYIDRSNSVHGLKNGNLFAYVDLAEMVPDLSCHSDEDIQNMVLMAVSESVATWWQQERFAKIANAEIHIITILNKDEYARASFDSAQTHGKIDFVREGDNIKAMPVTLNFDSMRTAIKKK